MLPGWPPNRGDCRRISESSHKNICFHAGKSVSGRMRAAAQTMPHERAAWTNELPHAMDRSAATNPNERQKVAFAAIKRKQENRYNQVEPFYTEEFLCNTDILITRAESM